MGKILDNPTLQSLLQEVAESYCALEKACQNHELVRIVGSVNQGMIAITEDFMVRYKIKRVN